MALTEREAYRRLRDAARQINGASPRIDAPLVVERGSIHWIDAPYPGASYTLVRGNARSLLFIPASDIEEAGWEQRLPQRIESASRYLAGFRRTAR